MINASRPYQLQTIPKSYQVEAIDLMNNFGGRVLLADQMGLGKTFESLLWRYENSIGLTIIVCPSFLKVNWQRELKQHFKEPSLILSGTKLLTYSQLHQHRTIIINYDILPKWADLLKFLNPELVVLDECHFIKSMEAKRTGAARKLCRHVPHLICCSGTPLTNRPSELWTTLNLLWPKEFPNFYTYAQRYCKPTRTPWGMQYKGATHLPELHGKLKKLGMIRRLKKDVLKDLPPIAHQVTLLEIERPKEYAAAEKDLVGWISTNLGKAKANRAENALRLIKYGYLKRLAANLKLKSIMEWLDNWLEESNAKILVFGVHKSILTTLYEKYKSQSVLVTGKVSQIRRQAAVDKFQTDKNIRILFGNIQAAGTGLNLTKASAVAFCEFPWAPGELDQAISRAHRIGQELHLMVYHLVARETIEEDLIERLDVKEGNIGAVLDGADVSNQMDIFAQLENVLLSRRKR
jgi:SWI/SNF-related matrix-associated actin-dependent regulator 1 of chromatin subfamily A